MSYCSNCALYERQVAELSAQLTEAQDENERLKNAIHPKRGDDPWWNTAALASLAAAHREDSESVDAAQATTTDPCGVPDYEKVSAERQQRLAEAHRHLGTALAFAEWHDNRGLTTQDLIAARAYYAHAARGTGGET